MLRFSPRLFLLLPIVGLLGCYDAARMSLDLPTYTARPGRQYTTMVAMSDGVKLHTEIYLPEGEGPWPVILIRNPYNFTGGFGYVAKLFSYYGYAAIHQLARGRAVSEGRWDPFLNERKDGLETLRWITEQPWHDGNIGMFGASYLSLVQWAVADELPPEVKTLLPMVWGSDVRGIAYEAGMFRHDLATAWAALMHDETLDMFNLFNYQKALVHRPHHEVDARYFGTKLDWYQAWISSPHGDAPLWALPETRMLKQILTRIDVPVLMVGGWYDIFIKSMVEDYQVLASRDRSRFVIGPWTHLLGMSGDGDKEFPDAKDASAMFGRFLNWFDHHLKGAPLDEWGPVETYTIGEGKWNTWESYPPAAVPARLYLHEPARANRCDGGYLLADAPMRAAQTSYVYDPENPVPSRGGAAMLSFAIPGWSTALPSSRNQAGLCERADVLTFLSPPLRKPLSIKGPIRVRLTVASDADDTAFTAKLIEVSPAGKAVNIRDSITSLAYRNGATMPVAYAAGDRLDIEFVMWPIEWTVQPGHRLRLDISSSNFPAYHAHPNVAGPWARQAATRKARQTIFVGPGEESFVDFPVWVPDGQIESARHTFTEEAR